MRTDLRAPDALAITYIAHRLRPEDARECFATALPDADVLARETIRAMTFGVGRVAWADGLPVAVIGAMPLWGGVWQGFAFGTDEWPQVARDLTRYARRVLGPALLDAGARRLEVRTIEGHAEAHAWLRVLGAEHEGTHPQYGANGETFFTFAWTRAPGYMKRAGALSLPRPAPAALDSAHVPHPPS